MYHIELYIKSDRNNTLIHTFEEWCYVPRQNESMAYTNSTGQILNCIIQGVHFNVIKQTVIIYARLVKTI